MYILISKKGGARVGSGRPSASGGRQEVYLGTGTEVNQTHNRLKGRFTAYKYLSLPHKATVLIRPND